jgi:hypothetical protein
LWRNASVVSMRYGSVGASCARRVDSALHIPTSLLYLT